MKKLEIFSLTLAVVALCAALWAQQYSLQISPPFKSTKTGKTTDSATAYLNSGGVDTTGWVRIPDSSATKGGSSVIYFATNEDTAQATFALEWGFLNPNTKVITPFKTTTALAAFDTTGIFNSTNSLTKSEPLCFRKPKGANVVRLLGTGGTLIGGWGAGGTGLKRVASWDVVFNVPK